MKESERQTVLGTKHVRGSIMNLFLILVMIGTFAHVEALLTQFPLFYSLLGYKTVALRNNRRRFRL